jgi:DNA-binding IscR family transcriptional regulator
MASAVQILCALAWLGPGRANAEAIARSLCTNPVVIRRLLKDMQRAGLVEIRAGKDGGVQFRRDPAAISLDHVYQAIESDTEIFALRRGGNPDCPVNRNMHGLLGPIFAAATGAVEATLGHTTIASLLGQIPARPSDFPARAGQIPPRASQPTGRREALHDTSSGG